MAIPMLDMKSTWAKIAAGLKGGKLFRTIPKKPSHPYTDGYDAMARQAAEYDVGNTGKPVFGGSRSFNNRAK